MSLRHCFCLIVCLVLPSLSSAAEDKLPAPFAGDTPESTLEIAYSDLDQFLKATVYVMGWSNREKAPSETANTGTRLKNRVNRLTALEGNRFSFEVLEDEEVRGAITRVKESLEALPAEVPLKEFNRNEQLAYWLNLYNFTFLDELAKAYPARSMKRLLDYGDEDSMLAKKVLNVAGIPLSLDDIQFNILLNKYHGDPLVIYGLFQGNIGGPSLQNHAFVGKTVWKKLEEVAGEFINSNRGTYYDGRISTFYERNLAFFDNDKEKVKDHLLDYLEVDMYNEILNAKKLKMDIEDWDFASLGARRQYGGAYMINEAALLDAVQSEQRMVSADGSVGMASVQNPLGEAIHQKAALKLRFSEHDLKMLKKIGVEQQMNSGKVEVTDLEEEDVKNQPH